jgi:hypothetical protein
MHVLGRPDCGQLPKMALAVTDLVRNWRGRDGNDPSVDIAKDADQRFLSSTKLSFSPSTDIRCYINDLVERHAVPSANGLSPTLGRTGQNRLIARPRSTAFEGSCWIR